MSRRKATIICRVGKIRVGTTRKCCKAEKKVHALVAQHKRLLAKGRPGRPLTTSEAKRAMSLYFRIAKAKSVASRPGC